MIFAFADDLTMCPLASVTQANTFCEPQDVEVHVYVFLDESGFVLRPIFRETNGSKWRQFLGCLGPKSFDLEPTDERRDDLLAKVESGEIAICTGPTSIRSLADLRKEIPAFLKQDDVNQ